MFAPVMKEVWRWEVPDPEDHWSMVGHLIVYGDGVVLVDPPMHPDLPIYLERLGGIKAIILTTHDHTRGVRYLRRVFGCPVYVPNQADQAVLLQAGIGEGIAYDEATDLPGGLQAIRCQVRVPMWETASPYLDEMVLVYQSHIAVTGDVAMGDFYGRVLACPEGFNHPADEIKVRASLTTLAGILPTRVDILLAGHGTDLLKDLRPQLERRIEEWD